MTPELRDWLEKISDDGAQAADELRATFGIAAGPRGACLCGAPLLGKRALAIYHCNACRQRPYRWPRRGAGAA
jgi:hypothetical protein